MAFRYGAGWFYLNNVVDDGWAINGYNPRSPAIALIYCVFGLSFAFATKNLFFIPFLTAKDIEKIAITPNKLITRIITVQSKCGIHIRRIKFF